MKIEKVELEFIRDDYGDRHFSIRDDDHAHELDIDGVYKRAILRGLITVPNPLEEALDAVDNSVGWEIKPDYSKKAMKRIIRKLHADLTDE